MVTSSGTASPYVQNLNGFEVAIYVLLNDNQKKHYQKQVFCCLLCLLNSYSNPFSFTEPSNIQLFTALTLPLPAPKREWKSQSGSTYNKDMATDWEQKVRLPMLPSARRG
jgi:hypothetical protein